MDKVKTVSAGFRLSLVLLGIKIRFWGNQCQIAALTVLIKGRKLQLKVLEKRMERLGITP